MTQAAEISISPLGNQSKVIWAVKGRKTFLQKVVCLVINMDKMVGGNFDTGLRKLKSLLEEVV